MSFQIDASHVLGLVALLVGSAFVYWNLRSYFRLRRVVYRPRLSGRVRHGDERRAERALMQRTFVQALLWGLGTTAFIAVVVPRLAAMWQGF